MSKSITGVRSLWWADEGTTGTPEDATPDPSWVELGKVLSGHEPGVATPSETDGMGAPVSAGAQSRRRYEVVDLDTYTALKAKETARERVVVAEKMPSGSFRCYDHCKPFVEYLPKAQAGKVQTLECQFQTAAHSWSAIREVRTVTP